MVPWDREGDGDMGLIRSIFQHKIVSFFWLIGLDMAFLALFQILGLYNSILAQQEDLQSTVYRYEAELSVDLEDRDLLERLDEILDIQDINVKIAGPDLVTSNGGTATYVQTILFQNEPEKMPMLSGSLPTADSQGGRQIAVGRYREEQVETRGDSAYFLADNEEYQVTGVIGTKQSDALDGYLVTNYHSLNGRQRRALGKSTLLLRFQSDIRDVEPYVQQAAEQIWKADPSANLDSHRTSQAVNGNVYIRESLKRYPFYMYVFCICIFIMISRQWVMQKERELAIRKAFGQGNGQLLRLLWKELSILTGLAFAVYAGISGILSVWMRVRGLSIRLHWSNLAIAAAFLIATFLISSLVPVWRLRRIQPAQLLNEK